jgi:hypothetical protein
MKKRARSENQHDKLMVFDFTKEIDVASCAPFRMSWDIRFPLSESMYHIFLPTCDISNSRLRVRWI